MPLLLLKTTTTDTSCDYYAECECAVVSVDQVLLDLLHRRAEIAFSAYQADDDLYELWFWNGYEAQYYDASLITDCADRDEAFPRSFENQQYALLSEGISLDAYESQRVECRQMVLRVDRWPDSSPTLDVAWSALPKHADLTITTRGVPLTVLKEFLMSNTAI